MSVSVVGLCFLVAFVGISSGQYRADPHSQESECFLDHFRNSSCPYDGLTSCIKELDFYYSYSSIDDNAIKIHLAQLAQEKELCLASPPKTPCVHNEVVRCTTALDILDVSQRHYTCKEIPKTKACLANISTVCKQEVRKEGLVDLVLDRIRITEIECRVGYYDQMICTTENAISCLNRFLDNGADCQYRAEPHSQESECFLEHFRSSSCPYDGLTSCIKELDFYYSYSSIDDNAIKIHLAQLAQEKELCLASPPKTPCVHNEVVRCTTALDILDVSQRFEICKEIPKTRACLANISTVCKQEVRKEGLMNLVLDRIRITEIECRVGYYDTSYCSTKNIIGCLNEFFESGADCRSTTHGSAIKCLYAVENRCQTTRNQELVKKEFEEFYKFCPN